jgi:hypothetical protein
LSPGVVKALRVFKEHFPELLKKHPGKWVACDGKRVLFVDVSHEVVYKQSLDCGLKEDEFVVLCLLPDAANYID